MTRALNSLALQRIFWKGVSMLHGCGFTALFACCDGASANRSFMVMNGVTAENSSGQNCFSRKPIFFISDPPKLLKKLRNNLYNSGNREDSPRFTRTLMKQGERIVWEHFIRVYNRDKRRHVYTAKLRKEHIYLDSLSKTRVKLAVQALSSPIARDMDLHDQNATEQTRKYIKAQPPPQALLIYIYGDSQAGRDMECCFLKRQLVVAKREGSACHKIFDIFVCSIVFVVISENHRNLYSGALWQGSSTEN